MRGRARRRRWPSLTERLLEDGRTLDDPDRDERAELARLQALGLIDVAWSRYFVCVDHADDQDLTFARSRTCNNKIPLVEDAHPDDPFQREDDRRYECGGCGRVHWPLRRRKTLRDRATVSLELGRAGAWVGGLLRDLVPDADTLRQDAAWRVPNGDDEAHLCLIDACAGSRFVTREFARSTPIIYIVMDRRTLGDRLLDAEWLRVVYLHELAERGVAALRERLAAVTEGEQPMMCREPAAPPWLPLRSPAPRVHHRKLGMHRLRFEGGAALLDGVEVLPADATGLVPVLRFLAERHHQDDVLADKKREDHCVWTPKEILDELEEQELTKAEDQGTVRRQLTRIRRRIRAAYLEATGIPLGADVVVENVPGLGYRINAAKVTVDLA